MSSPSPARPAAPALAASNRQLIAKIALIQALRADNAADPHPSFERLARADMARRSA